MCAGILQDHVSKVSSLKGSRDGRICSETGVKISAPPKENAKESGFARQGAAKYTSAQNQGQGTTWTVTAVGEKQAIRLMNLGALERRELLDFRVVRKARMGISLETKGSPTGGRKSC